jgi:hypothetical protein
MLAAHCPLPVPRTFPRYKKTKVSKICRCYYELDNTNSTSLDKYITPADMFYIITFRNRGDDGVYAVYEPTCGPNEVPKNNIVAFLSYDDAFRYKTLLEAEFVDKTPYVHYVSRFDIQYMCHTGGYGCRIVNQGALVTPPTSTLRITDWERRQALLDGKWTVQEKDSDV